jgi:CRP/FNR family transcriptional regulator
MSWLAEAPEFDSLAPEQRQRLAALRPMQLPQGRVLFRPGDAVQGYVIVLKGRIGVHLVGPTGREILLYDVGNGQSCIQSTLGLLGGEDYSAEAVCETDCRAVLLPRALFLDLIDSAPAFRRLVFAAFAARMQSVMHILESVAFVRVEARLARHLLDRDAGDGIVTATQADLARGVGSAREVMSRRLEALEQRGLLRREHGHIRLLDRAALERLATDAGM